MAAKQKYMVDLPDPNRPGEFVSAGPFTHDEVITYLGQWFGEEGLYENQVWRFFATEFKQKVDEGAGPRYVHDCTSCQFVRRLGRYDVYFCASRRVRALDTVILRYSDDVADYKSRPRHIHEMDPGDFAESIIYSDVFANYPKAEPSS